MVQIGRKTFLQFGVTIQPRRHHAGGHAEQNMKNTAF
jgi:hypothetical protein